MDKRRHRPWHDNAAVNRVGVRGLIELDAMLTREGVFRFKVSSFSEGSVKEAMNSLSASRQSPTTPFRTSIKGR